MLRLPLPELEPLSEQRWNKIEHAVLARLERDETARVEPVGGSRFVPYSASALVAILVFAMAWLWFSQPASEPSRLSTGASASHVVLPGLVLDLSPESAIVVSGSDDRSQLVVLDRGEVRCDVAHRRPGAPLFVQAGEVRVEVVGTRFKVTREGEAARVSVEQGMVKVSSRGVEERVAAGQSWPVVVRPAPHVVSPPSQPSRVEPESTSEPPAPRARLRRTVEAPISQKAAPSALQTTFEEAASLEARDPSRAIQLYRSLENGASSWAPNALFARGRLEAARGNSAEARRVLDSYLSRYPRGPNASDARTLLKRLE